MFRNHILICGGTGCSSGNSHEIARLMEEKLKAEGLENEVKCIMTGCFGLCACGPVVVVYPEGAFYSHVKPENVNEIVEEHIIKGRIVTHLLYKDPEQVEKDTVKSLNETQFYKKQTRVALRNCGLIDPENIDEYIAYDGYQALAKVLTEYSPQDVIDIIKASGLRGRGGGGFPTGLKWQFAYNSKSDKKYV